MNASSATHDLKFETEAINRAAVLGKITPALLSKTRPCRLHDCAHDSEFEARITRVSLKSAVAKSCAYSQAVRSRPLAIQTIVHMRKMAYHQRVSLQCYNADGTPIVNQHTDGPADNRLNGLDHLRALAITYVFLFHYSTHFPHPKWLERIGEFGWTGVDLFFVLSGYLVGGQLLRMQALGGAVAGGEFYIKRFFRIIPVYLLVVAIYFLIPGFREHEGIAPLWKFLTFTQNFGLDLAAERAFSHAWSLCVEEHFYLVLPWLIGPLAASGSARTAIWVGASVLIGGLILRACSWLELFHPQGNIIAWWEWVYYPTYNRLDGLLFGVCAAAVQNFMHPLWQRITSRWKMVALVGVALLYCSYVLSADQYSFVASVFSFPLIAAAYGCLLFAAVSPASVLHRIRLTTTSFMATWSYSIYLTHKGVIHLSQKLIAGFGIAPDSGVTFILATLVCVLVAWLLHLTVERPFMELRAMVLSRLRSMRAPGRAEISRPIF